VVIVQILYEFSISFAEGGGLVHLVYDIAKGNLEFGDFVHVLIGVKFEGGFYGEDLIVQLVISVSAATAFVQYEFQFLDALGLGCDGGLDVLYAFVVVITT